MEKPLTAEESLEIISGAIHQAKHNASRGGSFQILLWGWIIALANFGHYFLAKAEYSMPYIVWLLVIPGIVTSVYQGIKQRKTTRVTTHMDAIYGQIWLAAFVGIVMVLIFMNQLNFNHNPIILIIAGIGMYITGSLLRYKPIIFGAIVLWVGAIIGFNLPVLDQYLLGGIAIVIGYLIPGYLLKKEEK